MQIPRQITAGLLVNLTSLCSAIAMGWTSTMVAPLSSSGPDNPLPSALSVEDIGWIGSILAISGVTTAFLGGYLADKIGRKNTLLINALLFVASFLLMGIQPTYREILIARVLQGFAVGISMTVQAMYIGEIATDDCRGALGSFMNLFMSIGFLAMNSIGPYFPFVVVQRILLIFPCAFIVLFVLMPESPYYYVAKDRNSDAIKSLSFLRNKPKEDVLAELEKIELNVNATKGRGNSAFRELFKAGNLKALCICGVLIACQQLSGINGVLFYATTIFQESGLAIDPDLAVIVICVVQLMACIGTPFMADRWGRKPLLLFSCSFSALFLVIFAVYKYGVEKDIHSLSSLNWLPIVAIIGYLIAFSSGLASMPWAITAEVFPSNVKSYAVSIITCIAWFTTFFVTKFFQSLTLAIGSYSVFGIFAGFAALGFLFTMLVVFETKGLSLMEVQEKMNKRK